MDRGERKVEAARHMAGHKTPDGMNHARRFARWYLEDVLALEAERDGLKADNRRLTALLYDKGER
jgi:hypothetical protein